MTKRCTRNARFSLAIALSMTLVAISPTRGAVTYNLTPVSSVGAVQMGVTSLGPATSSPTFAYNAFTNKNDILLGPGQGYPTANFQQATTLVSQTGLHLPVNINQPATPVGSPAGSSFGGATVQLRTDGMGFELNDANGSGVASYLSVSSTTTYSANGNGFPFPLGISLGIAGSLPTPNSFVDVALVVTIEDSYYRSPLFGTSTYTILLGNQNTGSGFNPLSSAQYTSFTQDGTSFQASGVTVITTKALPAYDWFTVTTTLTAYGDPASIRTIDTSKLLSLQLNGSAFSLMKGLDTTPEPSSILLLGGGVLGLLCKSAACRTRTARKAD